jgi:energy-coupling factor transporter transmembrane protein EcfT
MAVSLEMRGFGDSSRRTFMSETHMVVVDYAAVAFFILFSVCLLRFL